MLKFIIKSFFGLILISLSFGLGALLYIINQPWVDLSKLDNKYVGKPSILLDINGEEWARFELDKREEISIKNMPKHVIDAFIAAEDWQFFDHPGISVKAILRSALVNIYKRKRAQGASTITQQLVRLLYFGSKKSFSRKIKEQLLAIAIEQQFSKEQILEAYLNNVYLGGGIYGIEAACQRFWSKSVSQATICESAILASIVQSPTKFCLTNSLENCKNRRNLILTRMSKLGFISQEECEISSNCPIKISFINKKDIACHLKESIRQFLEKNIKNCQLYNAGLKIQTTIDVSVQKNAESTFRETLEDLRTNIAKYLEGALISLDIETGQIRALVGGYDFNISQFNRAFQAQRQLGSIFKPLIYAKALELGKKFTDIEIDEPLSITVHNKIWTPRNSYRYFDGPMTLARALTYSNNIIAIKLFLEIGAQEIINIAKECGITEEFNHYPSLALGCIDTTLSEATGMINVFANHGVYVKPHYLLWVKDQWGNKIWRNSANNFEKRKVIEPIIADQVNKVLTNTIDRFRNRNPELWGTYEAFGKTGTTNDARTCWFVGSTPKLTTGIYIGRDDNQALGEGVYAFRTVVPIWRNFNNKVLLEQNNIGLNKKDKTQDKLTEDNKNNQNNFKNNSKDRSQENYSKDKFKYSPKLKEILIDGKTGETISSNANNRFKVKILDVNN